MIVSHGRSFVLGDKENCSIMADNSQREKIEQFTNLTGVEADRAKFYLESSGWNIEVCL